MPNWFAKRLRRWIGIEDLQRELRSNLAYLKAHVDSVEESQRQHAASLLAENAEAQRRTEQSLATLEARIVHWGEAEATKHNAILREWLAERIKPLTKDVGLQTKNLNLLRGQMEAHLNSGKD